MKLTEEQTKDLIAKLQEIEDKLMGILERNPSIIPYVTDLVLVPKTNVYEVKE